MQTNAPSSIYGNTAEGPPSYQTASSQPVSAPPPPAYQYNSTQPQPYNPNGAQPQYAVPQAQIQQVAIAQPQQVVFAQPQQVPLQLNTNASYQYRNAPQANYQAMNSNTSVIKQEPGDWAFGLCECFDDMSACCMTTWCPCLTAGEIWEKGLEKSFFGGCCLWALIAYIPSCILYLNTGIWVNLWAFCYPCCWSTPLRTRRGIKGNYCNDCCCAFWCGCCQMIREVREAKMDHEQRRTGAQVPGAPSNVPVQTVMI